MKEKKTKKKETVVTFVQHLLILTNISIAHWQRIQQKTERSAERNRV